MMSTIDIIMVMGFSMPMFSALVCCIMMIIYYCGNEDVTQKRLAFIMIAVYFMVILCWLGIILYIVDYNAFVLANSFFFLALMFDQVLLYYFVFSITGIGEKQRFSKIHYIIPLVLALVMGVWSLLVPYEVQYYIVKTRGENAPEYVWYSLFFSSTVPVFIIYNIIYPLLGFIRVRRYRLEIVNYSADKQRTSVRWLYKLIFMIWLTLPLAMGVLFVHKNVFFGSAITAFGAFIPIFQYLVICYNLMACNYVIILPPDTRESGVLTEKTNILSRRMFEVYIRNKRPYLNPKLKITDMIRDLGTNRTYLSNFINKEYGMNFSRYINLQRLEELDRMRVAPENKNACGIDLVLQAGFSSYRNYLRVKYSEDKMRTILF